MASCYKCGQEIELRNIGGTVIPIHPYGGCGQSGAGGREVLWNPSPRDYFKSSTEYTTLASFVNPNAICPVCSAPVFYYQSPHGGRVFFDELGPPWPKHPCTNNAIYDSVASSRGASPETSSASTISPLGITADIHPAEESKQTSPIEPERWYPVRLRRGDSTTGLFRAEIELLSTGMPIRVEVNLITSKLEEHRGEVVVGFELASNFQRFLTAISLGLVFGKMEVNGSFRLSTVEVLVDDAATALEVVLQQSDSPDHEGPQTVYSIPRGKFRA